MKKLLILIPFFATVACNQHNDIDDCIEIHISNFGKEICDDGATVKRYTFQGQTTFAIHPGNCGADLTDVVLDENCDTLGFLGGFAGSTEINGVDYYANATLEETIWQN